MKLFAVQLLGELRKLFARKRTFIGFGVFLAFEIVIQLLLRLERVQAKFRSVADGAGYDGMDLFSGLTIGFLVVVWTVFLLEALFLALVAGDVVSKEVEDGAMRMMLCRPVSRGRILLLKAIVSFFYTFVLTAFIMLTALVVGFAYKGFGDMFVYDPFEKIFAVHEFGTGLFRYMLAIPTLSLSLCTITALAFCFSCFNMKPAAATIITLSVLFADTILKNVPYFEGLSHFFVTKKMSVWVHVFDARIPWEMMLENYAWLMGINGTLLLVGWLAFELRDFKS